MFRVNAGIALIVVGLAGLILPVIPGIPLLVAGLALVAPDHPAVRWGRLRLARWFRPRGPTMKVSHARPTTTPASGFSTTGGRAMGFFGNKWDFVLAGVLIAVAIGVIVYVQR